MAEHIIRKAQGMSTQEAADALASGKIKDTLTQWAPAGRFHPERERLHGKIILHFLADHRAQKQPSALFTAGGPASGKSILREGEKAPKDAVLIDPDEIRKLLPEYGQMIGGGRADIASAATHEEASGLAKRITQIAMDRKMNVIVDGVGDSEPKKFAGKISAARDAGYHTEVHYADLPVPQAEAINQKRYEETDRLVPQKELREKHKGVAERYSEVRAIKGIHVRVYDTSVKGKVTPISTQGPDGKVVIHNPERQREFEAKAK